MNALSMEELIKELSKRTWYGQGELSIQYVPTWRNKTQRYEGSHFEVRFSRQTMKHASHGLGMGLTLREALEDALRRELEFEKGNKDYVGFAPHDQ